MKRTVSAIMLSIVLVSILTLAFDIPSVKATGTIYIRADGSIDPPTAPMQRNGSTYMFTSNINDSIVVQRSNIIVDGRGYVLQGSGPVALMGFDFSGVNSVTIRNTSIKGFVFGVYAYSSSGSTLSNNIIMGSNLSGTWLVGSANTVTNNRIASNNEGIVLQDSLNSVVVGNSIENNTLGIWLYRSLNNTVSGNNVTRNHGNGILLHTSSSYNLVSGNNLKSNDFGIVLYNSSSYNFVFENNIENNAVGGIGLLSSSNNFFYHNYIVDNPIQVYSDILTNVWDGGYPSGGNYWSDYTTRYPSAIEIDDSRIWNTPYVINASNQDNYPLMGPWTSGGKNVMVTPASGVSLTFANVASGGITTINETQSGPTPFLGYKIEGKYFDMSTTASYFGKIMIRLTYDDTNMTQQEEESLRLMRWNETTQQWEDITTYVDIESNVIYGETNHLSIFGVHSQLIHDLSIFGVHALKTIIGQGYPLQILVDIRNEGDFPEDFDVTVDLISGQIGYLSIFGVHLINGNTMTVSLIWNTADSAKSTYSLIAHISQVAYEIDTGDNTYLDGQVKVTIQGDITGDFLVNIGDVGLITANWQKNVPPAPPNVDINGDGKINVGDVGMIALNWQKHA